MENTTTIQLKRSGYSVRVISYYPYGAAQAMQAIFLANAKIDMSDAVKGNASDGNIKMDNIVGTVIKQITDEKMKYMVEAINDKVYTDKEELLAAIYELPASDVEQIKAEITRIEEADSVDSPKEQASQENTL